MSFSNVFSGRVGVCLALLGLSACSSTPAVKELPPTAVPSEEIKRLEDDLARAEQQQLEVFAPEAYKKARAALQDAREEKNSSEALHEIAIGRSYFDQMYDKGSRNLATIEEVALARKQATEANARVLFTSDFKKADEKLRKVTADLENGKDGSAKKERADLQKEYRDLELRSIKQTNLGAVKGTIDLAKKEGAKQHAPTTLARAEKNVDDVEAYIVGNRHNVGEIKVKSNEARLNAEQLLRITREAKATRKASPEEVALKLEAERNQVAAKQGVINAKENEIQSKEALLGDSREELARKQAQLGAVASERDQLEADKAFEAKFEEARAQFNESEAEVYKQGNSLTIRLKSLQFPKAKATLKGEDFALLAKVKDVISGFGPSTVVVEGHTDSDGSEKANLKLSNDRANAVTNYLISSEVVDRDQVTAVGYGYQKPLASNKTPADKAKNRRVDVIISPEKVN